MNTKDFYFDLPQELIAQSPADQRDHARLLQLDRQTGQITHRHFYDILSLLDEGDVLVVNNSRVIPARIYGEKEKTGGRCEILLLKQLEKDVWECLARPGRRLQDGTVCVFGGGILKAEFLQTLEDGNRIVRFFHEGSSIYEILEQIGKMPLPHYITKELEDNEQYQTVYAKEPGSAAAPTAGLHFTQELIAQLKEKGIRFAEVTLHVGLGTFRPVKEENITDHKMHTEWYHVSPEAAKTINRAKAEGHRVVAVGTTSCRTLESVYQKYGEVRPCSNETDIFIYPSYQFGVLDGLITNFHLPESTLIMLVSAFAGYDHTMHAYEVAVQERYRFYSFGDAMLIL